MSIKELAKEEYRSECFDSKICRYAYIQGAERALKEIENTLGGISYQNYSMINSAIREKINELRK